MQNTHELGKGCMLGTIYTGSLLLSPQTRVTWEEGLSVGSNRWTCGNVCVWGEVILVDDCCGTIQPAMGDTIPRQVDLCCIRMQVEQARESKPGSSLPSWFLL